MKCNACGAEVSYNVETKEYSPICEDCTKLSISDRQERMLDYGSKQLHFKAWGKFGQIDFQPLQRDFGCLVGYKMVQLMPDTRKKWVAEPNEDGTGWKAYLLRD